MVMIWAGLGSYIYCPLTWPLFLHQFTHVFKHKLFINLLNFVIWSCFTFSFERCICFLFWVSRTSLYWLYGLKVNGALCPEACYASRMKTLLTNFLCTFCLIDMLIICLLCLGVVNFVFNVRNGTMPYSLLIELKLGWLVFEGKRCLCWLQNLGLGNCRRTNKKPLDLVLARHYRWGLLGKLN